MYLVPQNNSDSIISRTMTKLMYFDQWEWQHITVNCPKITALTCNVVALAINSRAFFNASCNVTILGKCDGMARASLMIASPVTGGRCGLQLWSNQWSDVRLLWRSKTWRYNFTNWSTNIYIDTKQRIQTSSSSPGTVKILKKNV